MYYSVYLYFCIFEANLHYNIEHVFCIFRFFPGSQFFEIKLDPIWPKNNRDFTIVFIKVNPKA